MKTYNVCWSGGVDSTFIVTQLSQFPVVIRTFYIKGQTFRLSEPQELSAISKIREQLISDPRTKADIPPLEIIEKDDQRVKDREIVKAHRLIYMQLLEEYKAKKGGKLPSAGSQQIYADGAFISPQYVACASLAKYYGETFEIGLLLDDFEGRPFNILSTDIVEDESTKRKLMYVREDSPKREQYLLFQGIRLPIAGQGMYKRDVWKWYLEHDYLRIRAMTNFCQAPVIHEDGSSEPCGVCTACIGVIREKVLEPFTKEGLDRYNDYEKNHEKEPERFRLKGF